MERRGFPSARSLAEKAKVSTSTILRLLHGEGDPELTTVEAVARELTNGDMNTVYELAAKSTRRHGEWTAPPEASLLTPRQQAAVSELIRSITAPAEHLPTKRITRGGRRASRAGTPRAPLRDVDAEPEH